MCDQGNNQRKRLACRVEGHFDWNERKSAVQKHSHESHIFNSSTEYVDLAVISAQHQSRQGVL